MDKYILGAWFVVAIILAAKGEWLAWTTGILGCVQTARIIELLEKYKHD